MGYITNFIVYTLAMVGVIVVALLVFKNSTTIGRGKSSKYLKIIDSLYLGQRKTLYVVSTGKEQFLIAGDTNNTCLISKLNNVEREESLSDIQRHEVFEEAKPNSDSFQKTLESLPKQSFMDRSSNIKIKSNLLDRKTNKSVMRNLADILK